MTFEKFKSNVEQWAEARGIYQYSSNEAQLLKGLSELGELADAIVKGDKDALKDAIGDVSVCIVNASYFVDNGALDDGHEVGVVLGAGKVQPLIASIAYWFSIALTRDDANYAAPLPALRMIAEINDLQYLDCCESAWLEIMDRKGKMVAGGAFVKDE